MSEIFRLYDNAGAYQAFDNDEATDTGQTKPFYSVQIGQKETAGSEIKQQIRPGLRFIKTYKMVLPEVDYIAFMRFITNGSNDYTIQYAEVPSLLANDSEALETNNFKVALTVSDLESNASAPPVYYFTLTITSVRTL